MQMCRRHVARFDHGVQALYGDCSAAEAERSLRPLEQRDKSEGRPLHLCNGILNQTL